MEREISFPERARLRAMDALLFTASAYLFFSVAAGAVGYPGSVPSGEYLGGLFSTYFSNMLGDSKKCGSGLFVKGYSNLGVPNCVAP